MGGEKERDREGANKKGEKEENVLSLLGHKPEVAHITPAYIPSARTYMWPQLALRKTGNIIFGWEVIYPGKTFCYYFLKF